MLLAAPSPIAVQVLPDTSLNNITLALVIVTGILALATVILATSTIFSVRLQRQELRAVEAQLKLTREDFELATKQLALTQEVVQQQLRQAEATTAMARAMELEQELAARPYLTVEVINPPYLDDLMVHNVGRGPALNCIWTYLGATEPTWRRSKVFSVAPGTGRHLRASDTSLTKPGHPVVTPLWDCGQLNESGAHEVGNVHALFCHDETGTKLYRFIDGRVGYDIWTGEGREPPWVTYLRQEFPPFR